MTYIGWVVQAEGSILDVAAPNLGLCQTNFNPEGSSNSTYLTLNPTSNSTQIKPQTDNSEPSH
eukprot:310-Amphidinium_carterae.1